MNVHPKTILSMLLTAFLILGNFNRTKAEGSAWQTPTTLAESHFESGLDGWTIINDGSTPVHFSSGGLNNSGFIESYDLGQGSYWYWSAPAGFLGDKSAAYNGHLTFYLRQNYTNRQSNQDDLVLIGGGITLAFNTAYNPGVNWTSYDVPLQESYGWVDKATGLLASQAQMQAVLADLQSLQIRGEYRSGSDIGGIDSVVMTSTAPANPTSTPVPGTTGSSFDLDPDGWTIYDDGAGPVYYPAGGVSGGYIFGSDLGTGQYWYWNAPAKFLGDKSAYYGGSLSFHQYQTLTNNQSNRTDIVLIGGGITLNYDTPYNPGLTWTYYFVTLNEGAGWVDAATGNAPTQAQMQTVLTNLQTLRIRGEYRSGADSGGMDEVLLTAPPPTATPTASSTPTATFTPSPTATQTFTPTATFTPSLTATPSFTATFTLTPTITPTIQDTWYTGNSQTSSYAIKANISTPNQAPALVESGESSWVSLSYPYWIQTGWRYYGGIEYFWPVKYVEINPPAGYITPYQYGYQFWGNTVEYEIYWLSGTVWCAKINGDTKNCHDIARNVPNQLFGWSEVHVSPQNELDTYFSNVHYMDAGGQWHLFDQFHWREDSPYVVDKIQLYEYRNYLP